MMEGRQDNGSIMLIVAVICLIAFVFVLAYMLGQKQIDLHLTNKPSPTATPVVSPTGFYDASYGPMTGKCRAYGKSDKKAFLPTYIVKPGDTLSSIAKDQLGDPSLENELVVLNRDRFPNLYVGISQLTDGWILYLPPKTLHREFTSDLIELNAEVTKVGAGGTYYVSAPNSYGIMTIGSKTDLPDKQKFEVGDCITELIEAYDPDPLVVSLQ